MRPQAPYLGRQEEHVKHEVEVGPDNRASLWYVDRPRPESWRRNPWGFGPSQAGTTPERDAASVTWADAAKAARADFTVEARDTFTLRSTPDADGKRALRVPGARTLVRVSPETALANVSDSYGVVQNAEVLAMLDTSALRPDSLAVLDGGRRLYAQAVDRDDEVRADATGKVRTFRTIFWGHDGLSAILGGRTRVGIVCTNTYGHAKASLADVVRIVHRSGASRAVANAVNAAEREAEDHAAWLTAARRMAETKRHGQDTRSAPRAETATDILTRAFQGESTDLSGRARNAVTDILGVLRRANPSTGVVGDGSLWDVFQAASFYASHERSVRGAEGGAAEVARRLSDTPEWLDRTWTLLAETAEAARPTVALVRS